MAKIGVGDIVVATRNGGHDRQGLPTQRPRKGKMYRVTAIYEMQYGLGCCLAGMDPFPYMGYFLFVKKGENKGWYFKKVEKADEQFTQMLRGLKPKVTEKTDVR